MPLGRPGGTTQGPRGTRGRVVRSRRGGGPVLRPLEPQRAAWELLRTVDAWDSMQVDVPFDAALPQRSVMLDRTGKTFATLFSENRIPLTRAEISPLSSTPCSRSGMTACYSHGGVDLQGTARALTNNSDRRSRQGASTITQQWIKNVLLAAADTPEREGRRRRRECGPEGLRGAGGRGGRVALQGRDPDPLRILFLETAPTGWVPRPPVTTRCPPPD